MGPGVRRHQIGKIKTGSAHAVLARSPDFAAVHSHPPHIADLVGLLHLPTPAVEQADADRQTNQNRIPMRIEILNLISVIVGDQSPGFSGRRIKVQIAVAERRPNPSALIQSDGGDIIAGQSFRVGKGDHGSTKDVVLEDAAAGGGPEQAVATGHLPHVADAGVGLPIPNRCVQPHAGEKDEKEESSQPGKTYHEGGAGSFNAHERHHGMLVLRRKK
ncbi:MAG: hypothetical protein BWY83_02974 [bacterium ADurb.Bin478]|nr:MAG: hypothetical protein BWY83_02974 [bacterium ADurb.Bin478]